MPFCGYSLCEEGTGTNGNIEAVGAKVIHLYGLTETYGPSTLCQWQPEWHASNCEEQVALKARQGVADLMVEQRVVRDDMTDVEPNGKEVGEIVIRGNALMKGYYRDPEATQHAFRGAGSCRCVQST